MRVLHVFDHSLPLQSGYVSRSLGILRSQNARGWRTIHLTSPRHGAWTVSSGSVETIDGLTFHRSPSPSIKAPLLREIAEMRMLRRRISEIAARERPDIIHAHSPVLNAVPAISVGRRFGIPVVYEIRAFWEDAAVDHGRSREGDLRYRAARWLDTRTMRRADAVVAICTPLRDEFLGRGIAPERVSVVPNAVDARFLDPPPARDEALKQSLGLAGQTVLGFIGSFYTYEGLDVLLEALPTLRREVGNLSLLLVGGGPDEQRLREIADARGLGDIVKFVGRVKLDDVARYYQMVDIFVYPRRRMRLTDLVTPLKPLEAMAQMRPLAASDVLGHRELIRASETGYLFAPDNPTALASCIRAIMADPEGRARVAANGRRFVETERSWDTVVARYATIYDDLLSGHRPRPNP